MKIRNFITTFVILFISISLHAQKALTLELKNGNQIQWNLDKLPTVSVVDTKVQITIEDDYVLYNLNEVDRFYITETTGIDDIRSNKLSVSVSRSSIGINGLEKDERIQLVSLDGGIIYQCQSDSEGNAEIEINYKGVLVIKTSHQSLKIIKE